ncbi:phosphoglycerate kinase [Portibacter lacus]|uniref:Phosphoglycerate kinase n=1 Tax=Portibacter lacus TaxID=1099794 RepID=A0AA37SUJ7_9BACT|nr:phosphoglycerate kinase [Portibacter lacus]GLR18393.1 phosphoglycerate kinase [Portibacter lacus]
MNLDFNKQKVLVRVDFNVPLNSANEITDDTRIQKALPTLKYILDHGGALILMSHLGRPLKKKKEDGTLDVEKFTLQHLVNHLTELLGVQVNFASDCVGEEATKKAGELEPGQVLLLENTRFHEEEEKGDVDFAKQLASLADLFVNDAFGTAHRAHASTTTVAQFFDADHKTFGYLMESEIANGTKLMDNPDHPVTAIIGGAKVSDKIQLIDKITEFADHILIGGGMSYTFLKAKGGSIGNSLFEEDYVDLAKKLLKKCEEKGVQLHLPQDSKIADDFKNDANMKTVASMEIPDGWMGLDIGPYAIEDYRNVILSSKTILWNGPVGVFEMSSFSKGTFSIAQAVADATQLGAFSLIGGGDSVSAINKSGLSEKVSFISTGGGAMLEFLEGKELPGIKAIKA